MKLCERYFERRLLLGKANGTFGFFHPPRNRQRASACTNGHDDRLLRLVRLCLVDDQHEPLAVGRQTFEHVAGKRRHHDISIDKLIAQKTRDPLVTHIDALEVSWQ